MKELEIENHFNYNDDNETIFENCDDIEQKIKDINTSDSNFTIDTDDDEDIPINQTNSLLGDGAIKYDIKMFARRKR